MCLFSLSLFIYLFFTNADVPGLLGNLNLHVPTKTLGIFPAVPSPHDIKISVWEEAFVDGGDSGGGD